MEELIDVLPTATPIVCDVDYSLLVSKIDTLIDLNASIYSWLALFITLVLCGFVVYMILKPLTYF